MQGIARFFKFDLPMLLFPHALGGNPFQCNVAVRFPPEADLRHRTIVVGQAFRLSSVVAKLAWRS